MSSFQAYDERKRFPIMPAGTGVWHPFPSVHIPDNYSSAKVTEYLANIPLFRFSHTEGVIAVEEVGSDDDEVFDFTQPTQEGRKAMFVASTLKRADLFIRSKKIREMLDCVRDKHYYVKAEVRASFRDLTYNLSTMIARASGNVCLAECSCKALALGRCCHITAILLLIGRHVQRHGHEGEIFSFTLHVFTLVWRRTKGAGHNESFTSVTLDRIYLFAIEVLPHWESPTLQKTISHIRRNRIRFFISDKRSLEVDKESTYFH